MFEKLGDLLSPGTATLTFDRMLATLLIAVLVGIFIFYVYKLSYRGVIYSHSFNVTIVLSSVITSMIVLGISSNITLSLGMVGALSIVRFRAAIKDPVDIIFLFWAISSGIVAGTGEYWFLIIATLVIGVTAIVLFKARSRKQTYLLIIDIETAASSGCIKECKKLGAVMKSKSVIKSRTELVFEIKIKDNSDTSFVEKLSSLDTVASAVLVGYNGDFAE